MHQHAKTPDLSPAWLDPARVRDLLHSVRQGKVFDLGQRVTAASPRLPMQPPYTLAVQGMPISEMMGADNPLDVYAEHAGLTFHVGTHIDALGHFAASKHWFGGVGAATADEGGLASHGIDQLGPLVSRAVVVDVASWRGAACLDPSERVTRSMLEQACAAQGNAVETGDVVLVRTGWGRHYGGDSERYVASEPGIDEEAARYLSRCGAIAVGADNMALEVLPFTERHQAFPVHQHLLVEAGVHIIENLALDAVCAAGVRAGVFFLLPVKFVGATASPATPILVT